MEDCGEMPKALVVNREECHQAITKGGGDNSEHLRTHHDEEGHLNNDEYEEDEDISSPSGTMLGTNVIEVFQPKLVQVIDAYRMYLSSQSFPDFDHSKHLLILCLDHLITFCSWARASPVRSSWISKTLEENSDLRPEVRNGLCMIMVYGFSAAKAAALNDGKSDMFSVLQEADTGFGIVNKTSLKVYNDPYQYFNFLKYCVSGLIDVGRIPENERINQPKRPKKYSDFTDELTAFAQLKDSLADLLDRGEQAAARGLVEKIVHLWHFNSKNIRTQRFVMAMSLVCGPVVQLAPQSAGIPLVPIGGLGGYTVGDYLMMEQLQAGNGLALRSMQGLSIPAQLAGAQQIQRRGLVHGQQLAATPGGTMITPGPGRIMLAVSDLSQLQASQNQAAMAAANVPQNVQTHSHGVAKAKNDGVSSQLGKRGSADDQSRMNKAVRSRQGSEDSGVAAQGLQVDITPTYSVVSSSDTVENLAETKPGMYNAGDNIPRAGGMHGAEYPAQHMAPEMCQVVPARAVRVLRYERVGTDEWDLKEGRVFNIDEFLSSVTSTIYFVDEKKLPTDELRSAKMQARSTGLITLESELTLRGALVAAWPKALNSSLSDLTREWNRLCNAHQSLMDIWKSSPMPAIRQMRQPSQSGADNQPSQSNCNPDAKFGKSMSGGSSEGSKSTGNMASSSSASSSPTSASASQGLGILVYEMPVKIGFILRANPALGINEDCWRALYPKELYSMQYSIPFEIFLGHLFPQIRAGIAQAQAQVQIQAQTQQAASGFVIKYCPHDFTIDGPHCRLPDMNNQGSYLTIGTLQETAAAIIGRLEISVPVHDFIIQL